MNDQIETATEALPPEVKISLASTESYVVTALAMYGLVSLTNDLRNKVSKIQANRKAKKAAETVETNSTEK